MYLDSNPCLSEGNLLAASLHCSVAMVDDYSSKESISGKPNDIKNNILILTLAASSAVRRVLIRERR